VTVLLHTANFLRRRQHWTETLIVEDGAGLKVVKRLAARDPAAPAHFSESLAERHARLSAAQSVVRLPALLEAGERELVVEHVAGETSLARIERCLHERRFAAAQAEVDAVLGLLARLPSTETDPHGHEGFRAVFDPDDRAGRHGAERCLLPGLYDFGLGNLIIPADPAAPRVLVDWEWTFPFPVPAAFVAWVVVRNTAEYLQPAIRALCGPELPGLIYFDDVVIPEGWARAAGLDVAAVARFLALETAIQSWIHVCHRPLERFAIHPEPRRVDARRDENATLLTARLRAEAAAAAEERDALARTVAEQDAELAAQRRLLADIGGVKYATRHTLRLVRRRLGSSR
jgi:hypothetical protein